MIGLTRTLMVAKTARLFGGNTTTPPPAAGTGWADHKVKIPVVVVPRGYLVLTWHHDQARRRRAVCQVDNEAYGLHEKKISEHGTWEPILQYGVLTSRSMSPESR